MRRGAPLVAATLLAALAPPLAGAEDRLSIDIRGSGGRDYQIAVQGFAGEGAAARLRDDFHRELSAALEFSGLFVLVNEDAFLEPLITQDYDRATLPCANWRGIGSDVLVEGEITLDGDTLQVRSRVWDTIRCRLQGKAVRKRGALDTLERMARSLADEIVERFTGIRGVASTQIAFVSTENGNKEVYLMEADGAKKRRVTGNGTINLFPSWSPDAASLVYTSFKGGRSDLWMVFRGPRTQGRKLLDLPEPKYRGVWAPDDGRLAIDMSRGGTTDLFTVKKSGRGLERLTRHRAIETSPAWSPDGSELAFVSDRSGGPQIYVKNLDTGEERRLTFQGKYNASPAWSPTGQWIAYTAQTGSSFDLYLIDPKSGYTTPLVIHPRSDEDPAWSPDGRKLVFSSNRRGRRDLYRIDVDGRHLTRLTHDYGECSNPAWSGWLD